MHKTVFVKSALLSNKLARLSTLLLSPNQANLTAPVLDYGSVTLAYYSKVLGTAKEIYKIGS
jgi:hypothetical protein